MDIKETVKNAIGCGYAPVPRFRDRESGEWVMRKYINKDTGQYGYPLEHKAWNTKDMPIVSLVLRNTLLIDLDGNKDGAESIEELQIKVCEKLGIDEFDLDEALFQENEEGDSLHYIFKLPDDVSWENIANSNDGNFIKNVDFKTGRQLVNLKPGKIIHWQNIDDLPVVNKNVLLSILPEVAQVDYSIDDFEQVEESTPYGIAAMRGINERATVFVEEGERNHRLACAVVSTYELVAGGQISEGDAEKSINEIVTELGIEEESDTKTTIKFNKEKGMRQPKKPSGLVEEKKVTPLDVTEKVNSVNTLEEMKETLTELSNFKMDNLTQDVLIKTIQSKYKQIAVGSPVPSVTAIKKEMRSLKKEYKTGDYVDDYVFLTSTGEYCHRDTKAVMGPRSFDVKHNRETPSEDGEPMTACGYANMKIEVVENTMYFPIANEIFTHDDMKYLNSYKPSSLVPVPVGTTNIVDRVKGHIAHLLPDASEQSIVTNYLAHNIQYPGKKLQWAIVLQGVQGDGKSFLSEMMRILMGEQNVRLMNVQTLESSFTGWATGQCMTFIEELKLDNFRKYEVLNNLKPYISNPIVEETKKGKDPRTVVNTTNYFALTNFKDAIPIDENDRRYCILFSQWQRKEALQAFMSEHTDYYPNLYNDMRENAGELLAWLLSHKIDDAFMNMKRAPDTNAKSMMKELSKSPEVMDLEEAVERFADQCMLEDGVIDITRLGKIVENERDFDPGAWADYPKTKQIKNILLMMGWEFLGRKRTLYSEGDNKNTIYRM